MVMTKRPPAIAGVSTGTEEAVIATVYPSIAATAFGRGCGRVLDCIPTRLFGLKISNLLFGLLVAPLAALAYILMKLFGQRYVLTNRAVQVVSALGYAKQREVQLTDVSEIGVAQHPGQEFYKAADIFLMGKDGRELVKLSGIPYAGIFKQTLLEARLARLEVNATLERIRSRG